MQYCLQDAFRIKIGYETVIENYFNQYMYIRICMVFHSALNINWHKETNKAVLNKQTNKQTDKVISVTGVSDEDWNTKELKLQTLLRACVCVCVCVCLSVCLSSWVSKEVNSATQVGSGCIFAFHKMFMFIQASSYCSDIRIVYKDTFFPGYYYPGFTVRILHRFHPRPHWRHV